MSSDWADPHDWAPACVRSWP